MNNTNSEILERAIQKALANGWKPTGDKGTQADMVRYVRKHSLKLDIFNHDFAKALWGDDSTFAPIKAYDTHYETIDVTYRVKRYQYHLQKMVIAEDPIKYLGDNI